MPKSVFLTRTCLNSSVNLALVSPKCQTKNMFTTSTQQTSHAKYNNSNKTTEKQQSLQIKQLIITEGGEFIKKVI